MWACNPLLDTGDLFPRTRATGPVAWTLVCHPRGAFREKYRPHPLRPSVATLASVQKEVVTWNIRFEEKLPFQRAAEQPPPTKTWLKQPLQLLKRDKSGDVVGTQQEDLWTHVPRDPGVPAVVGWGPREELTGWSMLFPRKIRWTRLAEKSTMNED